MKAPILELLVKELKAAEVKEKLAEENYKEKKRKGGISEFSMAYAQYQKAQGYTNGILESIDIVRRYRGDE